jgi:hypothetical protein
MPSFLNFLIFLNGFYSALLKAISKTSRNQFSSKNFKFTLGFISNKESEKISVMKGSAEIGSFVFDGNAFVGRRWSVWSFLRRRVLQVEEDVNPGKGDDDYYWDSNSAFLIQILQINGSFFGFKVLCKHSKILTLNPNVGDD